MGDREISTRSAGINFVYLLQRVGVQISIYCGHEREFVSPKSFVCFRHLNLYLVYSFQFKFTVYQNDQLCSTSSIAHSLFQNPFPLHRMEFRKS